MEQLNAAISRLRPGMELKKDYVVKRADTARANGSGGLEVLATPVLVTWMESAAYDMAALCLPDNMTTVGVRLSFDHLSATPVDMKVRIKVVLKEIDRRRLSFTFEAWDKAQRICYGDHDRVIVEKTPFMEKVLEKRDRK